jgi:hypothetical protein
VLVALPLVIAGCSTGGGTGPSASLTSGPGATAGESSPGPGLVGPVILTPEETSGQVELGRTVVFNLGDDPAGWRLVASDASVLALEPGGERDGATFNWGATTLTVGRSTVVATPTNGGSAVTFEVTVVPA